MNKESLVARLEAGDSLSAVFDVGTDEQALVEVWKYEGRLILTWEQCRHGDQYNEHAYTRDERLLFDSVDQVCAFLEKSAVPLAAFDK